MKSPCTSRPPSPSRRIRHADAQHRVAAALAQARELDVLLARHGDEHPAGRLAEQGGRGVDAVALQQVVEPDPGADAEAQHALGERRGEAAVGEVVRGVEQSLVRGGGEQPGERLLALEVDGRRASAEVVVHDAGPGRAVELERGRAEQVEVVARVLPAGRDAPATSSIVPSTATTGVGWIGTSPVWL